MEKNSENSSNEKKKVKTINYKSLLKNMKKNPWMISTLVLVVLAVVFIIFTSTGICCTGKTISEKEAGNYLVNYLAESAGVSDLEIVSIKKVDSTYLINIGYQGETIPFYVTNDGYILGNYLVSVIPDKEIIDQTEEPTQQTNVPKSDKPVVELFVMSYCPYGTQAEKGIIPALEVLGDSVDFKLRFVDYLMHGEEELQENLREYCIQETYSDKFLDYMTCFLEGDGIESNGYITNGNDPESCMVKFGIDKQVVNSCMTETDKEYSITEGFNDKSTWLSGYYPLFNVDKDLNDKYGVQGSPTLVINGVIVSASRDPASMLSAICASFNQDSVPEACSTTLSSSTPTPYFGWNTASGSSTTAQCG